MRSVLPAIRQCVSLTFWLTQLTWRRAASLIWVLHSSRRRQWDVRWASPLRTRRSSLQHLLERVLEALTQVHHSEQRYSVPLIRPRRSRPYSMSSELLCEISPAICVPTSSSTWVLHSRVSLRSKETPRSQSSVALMLSDLYPS